MAGFHLGFIWGGGGGGGGGGYSYSPPPQYLCHCEVHSLVTELFLNRTQPFL